MLQLLRRGRINLDRERPQDDYRAGLVHSAKCVDAEQAQWLASLPYELSIPGARVAHASLNEPAAWNYIFNAVTAEPTLTILRQGKARVGFFGHTHVQGIFPDVPDELVWLDETGVGIPDGMACVVMGGSAGQPRHDTDRRAAWVLWDPEAGVVEFRKKEYKSLEAVQ
jgi:hypothetical protein